MLADWTWALNNSSKKNDGVHISAQFVIKLTGSVMIEEFIQNDGLQARQDILDSYDNVSLFEMPHVVMTTEECG